MRKSETLFVDDYTLPGEEWRPIPGHEGYEASSLGRIRSIDRWIELDGRWGPCQRFLRGRILRPYISNASTGGNCLALRLGARHRMEVGRGVALAFHGEPPTDEHEAAHQDSDGMNNTPGNLVWATRAEISELCVVNGASPAGSRQGRHKVVEAQIPPIIERYASGESMVALAQEYGVSKSTIALITRGAGWGHVASPMRKAAAQRAKQNLLIGRTAAALTRRCSRC
jgi:hypothetical protein